MSKAINAFIEKQHDDERNVTTLRVLDFLHPKGERVKVIVKKKQKNPTEKLVTKIREVTYLYDKDKVSKGWEIVEEATLPLGLGDQIKGSTIDGTYSPHVVESVVKDLRTKVENDSI